MHALRTHHPNHQKLSFKTFLTTQLFNRSVPLFSRAPPIVSLSVPADSWSRKGRDWSACSKAGFSLHQEIGFLSRSQQSLIASPTSLASFKGSSSNLRPKFAKLRSFWSFKGLYVAVLGLTVKFAPTHRCPTFSIFSNFSRAVLGRGNFADTRQLKRKEVDLACRTRWDEKKEGEKREDC